MSGAHLGSGARRDRAETAQTPAIKRAPRYNVRMKTLTKLFPAALAAALIASCSTTDTNADASPMTLCVISMEDAEGGPTAEFEGKTVSFCCNSCKKRWNKMGDNARRRAIAKLEANN